MTEQASVHVPGHSYTQHLLVSGRGCVGLGLCWSLASLLPVKFPNDVDQVLLFKPMDLALRVNCGVDGLQVIGIETSVVRNIILQTSILRCHSQRWVLPSSTPALTINYVGKLGLILVGVICLVSHENHIGLFS